MGIYKCTYFFNSNVSGWTESYYNQAASPDAAIVAADRLAKALMRLRGTGIDMPHIRVSDVDVRGDSLISETPGYTTSVGNANSGLTFIKAGVESPADVSWTAAIISLAKDNVVRARVYMRGINDEFFHNDRVFLPDDGWKLVWNVYKKEISDPVKGWGVMRSPLSHPSNTFKIIGVIVAAGTNMQLKIAPGFAAAAGSIVKVRGMRSDRGSFSQNLTVVGMAGPFLEVVKVFPNPQPVFVQDKGTVQVQGPAFTQQLIPSYGKATTRHAGRPFGSPVGRRRRALVLQ